MPLTREDLPPGYPPKMGEITGTLGGKPVAWETFDYSIGAFDASAQARADWNTRVISLSLMGTDADDIAIARAMHAWHAATRPPGADPA